MAFPTGPQGATITVADTPVSALDLEQGFGGTVASRRATLKVFPAANLRFDGGDPGTAVAILNLVAFDLDGPDEDGMVSASPRAPGAGTLTGAQLKRYSIAGHTASGGAEVFAHGLGTAPLVVIVTPVTTAGAFTIAKSANGTNITITATAGLVYDIFAM